MVSMGSESELTTLTPLKPRSFPIFTPSLPGSHSKQEPPDPISNSEVKMLSADDSVGSPHVKVGHCQAFK